MIQTFNSQYSERVIGQERAKKEIASGNISFGRW